MGTIWQRVAEAMHPSVSDSVNPTRTDAGVETELSMSGEGQERAVSQERLSIARDFSTSPGGAESAREFLKILAPLLHADNRVIIDLDGLAALPASFLKYVFHALVTEYRVPPADLLDRVQLEATDPELKIYVSMADKYAREEIELAAA